eukprot:14453480-Heterocapsa_arctica.AAC.1
MDYPIKLGDVSTTFLHATLPTDEFILVEPPPSLRRPGWLWRLRKALYGLRVSPRLFQEFAVDVLKNKKWTRLRPDPQMFVHEQGALLTMHADDILLAESAVLMAQREKELNEDMNIKWGSVLDGKWR